MMHKRRKRRSAKMALFYSLMFLCAAFSVAAQRATHNHRVKAYALSSSGQKASSTDFKVRNTLGQPTPVGWSHSPGFRVTAGFQPITMVGGEVLTAERGDINGDGGIDVLDIVVVVTHILGTQSLTGDALYRADCNGDGVIDVLDALSIVNVILGFIPGCPGTDVKPVMTREIMEFFESMEDYLPPDEYAEFMTLCKEHMEIPTEYSLGQNYPNPFNPTTTIHFAVPDAGRTMHHALRTSIRIYNILGQEVRILVDEEMEPGYYTRIWNGTDTHGLQVSSGVYFYRLTGSGTSRDDRDEFTAIRRMVFMK